jgi:hypothetical protein
MISYSLTDPITERSLVVSLDAPAADSVVPIVYEGEEELVREVKAIISQAAGIYGHLLGEKTSPLDVDLAMRSNPLLTVYSPHRSGKINQERATIPPGAQS